MDILSRSRERGILANCSRRRRRKSKAQKAQGQSDDDQRQPPTDERPYGIRRLYQPDRQVEEGQQGEQKLKTAR